MGKIKVEFFGREPVIELHTNYMSEMVVFTKEEPIQEMPSTEAEQLVLENPGSWRFVFNKTEEKTEMINGLEMFDPDDEDEAESVEVVAEDAKDDAIDPVLEIESEVDKKALEPKNPLQCVVCGKVCRSVSGLKSHMRSHR